MNALLTPTAQTHLSITPTSSHPSRLFYNSQKQNYVQKSPASFINKLQISFDLVLSIDSPIQSKRNYLSMHREVLTSHTSANCAQQPRWQQVAQQSLIG